MSRLGTCKHSFEIQEIYHISACAQPHEKSTRVVDGLEYTCQWLDTLGALPPPVKRANGGFILCPADCDACPQYKPAIEFPEAETEAHGD